LNPVIRGRQCRQNQITDTVALQARPRIESKVEGAVEYRNLFVFLRTERNKTLPYVTEWWVAEFLAEYSSAAAAVEHRHDDCQIDVVILQAAQSCRRTASSADYYDAFAVVTQSDIPFPTHTGAYDVARLPYSSMIRMAWSVRKQCSSRQKKRCCYSIKCMSLLENID